MDNANQNEITQSTWERAINNVQTVENEDSHVENVWQPENNQGLNKDNKKWKTKLNIAEKFHNFSKALSSGDKNVKWVIPVVAFCLVAIAAAVFMVFKTMTNFNDLNKSANELYKLDNFDISELKNDENIREDLADVNTLNDLLNLNSDINESVDSYSKFFEEMQAPYNNLMTHILLPQLNIWKDPFLGTIDTSIIWAKFLEKNPYNDITLITTWSNFFKNLWSDNTIENIEVWDLVEDTETNLYHIPVSIQFTANSKRSFLLLVEWLSITSNQKNLSLINEFIYNLRDTIKSEKAEGIAALKTEILSGSEENKNFSEDAVIGYNLYNWIFNEWETNLITDDIIEKTIKSTVSCNEATSASACLYKFREKFRWIPSLAYTLWIDQKDKTNILKTFLQELPPVIKIDNFTYNKDTSAGYDIINYGNIAYEWSLNINIYWKGISNDEVTEISQTLWNLCIWKDLTPDAVIENIEAKIMNIGNTVKFDSYSTSNLLELNSIIKEIWANYEGLSNYNKVVKLFEIYRMMKEWNICN